MTTIQVTTNLELSSCKKCGKTPAVAHVDDRGRSIFAIGCCGKSKSHQFFSVAIDGWNFDMRTL